MTAKEKATEIFNFYHDATDYNDGPAITCSVYCIDQLIKQLIILQINESHDAWVVDRVNWLKEVKEELNKL